MFTLERIFHGHYHSLTLCLFVYYWVKINESNLSKTKKKKKKKNDANNNNSGGSELFRFEILILFNLFSQKKKNDYNRKWWRLDKTNLTFVAYDDE